MLFNTALGGVIVRNDRLTRLTLVAVVMLGLVGLMFMTVDPEIQYTVDEVMESPEDHDSSEIHLRGIVRFGSVDNQSSTFTLEGLSSELSVSFASIAVPDGFEEGRTIAVKGELSQDDGNWHLSANAIQTGCPSKYETE
jgi:cytochrome c-type biogenesis protein CcmE